MFNLDSYSIVTWFFPRLMGLVYFCAFGPFIFQIKGLLGKNGILPISRYLNAAEIHYKHKRFIYVPSLFWINSSDQALMGLTVAGTILSICLMLGFYPALILFLLYCLYLSIVSTGQNFLGFGWEGFMLEVTAHAFLLSLAVVPNLMVWISVNFLLFRFHFQAGAVKLQSRDKNWRNLTALAYHYQTQPLPNTIAWFVHKCPLWFHQLSTAMMFIVEMVISFGIFGTETMRLFVFLAFFGLQFMIWATGNFSYLNYLTVVLSTILLSNTYLAPIVGNSSQVESTSLFMTVILSILGTALFALQVIRFWFHFFPDPRLGRILYWTSFFHLANRYGIFAVMTTERYEVVVEGSEDGVNWKEYTFRYKPSEVTRRPRRIAPYQPRIDWQAWFLPFSDFYSEKWFQNFLSHLLKGTPEVISLIRNNPFPDKPPLYVRALFYDYQFSSVQEKKEKGWWWKRTLIGQYSPVVSLKTQND